MTCWAFIFARNNSKGVPGKNTKLLCGKPLISHAIEHAKQTDQISRVFVSTDSHKIAEIAEKAGAEVPFLRPPELAQDTAHEWQAWQHAVAVVQSKFGKFETFVSVPTTAPCRDTRDIGQCINALDDETDIAITVTKSNYNPYFNMVKKDERGFVRLIGQAEGQYYRRQDAPTVYGITPVAYVSRPTHILSRSGVWDGRVKTIQVEPLTAIDIDNPDDFYLAELILTHRKGRVFPDN